MSDELDRAEEEMKESLEEATAQNEEILGGTQDEDTEDTSTEETVDSEINEEETVDTPSIPEPTTDDVTDYDVVKAKNIMATIIETGMLPSKDECLGLIDLPTDNEGVKATKTLLEGLLNGATMPSEKHLNRIIALL